MTSALTRPVRIAAFPFLALTLVFAGRVADFGSMGGYAVGLFAQAALTVGAIAPLTAALASWQAGRIRRRITPIAPTRSRIRQALSLLGPVALLGMGCLLVSAFMAGFQSSGVATTDTRVLIPAALTVLASIGVGHLFGTVLSPVAALPLSLIGTWAWLAFPISTDPPWLRHLTLAWGFDCCTFSRVPDTSVIVAPSILAIGVILAWITWMLVPNRLLGGLCGALIMVSGVAVAVARVNERTYDPTTARPATDLECTTERAPTVCAWPETAQLLEITQSEARAFRTRLQQIGLTDLPATVSAADLPDGSWHVVLHPGMSGDAIRASLLSGVAFPSLCAGSTGGAQTPATEWALRTWLAERTGQPREPRDSLPPDVRAILEKTEALPLQQQREWFTDAIPGSTFCPPATP